MEVLVDYSDSESDEDDTHKEALEKYDKSKATANLMPSVSDKPDDSARVRPVPDSNHTVVNFVTNTDSGIQHDINMGLSNILPNDIPCPDSSILDKDYLGLGSDSDSADELDDGKHMQINNHIWSKPIAGQNVIKSLSKNNDNKNNFEPPQNDKERDKGTTTKRTQKKDGCLKTSDAPQSAFWRGHDMQNWDDPTKIWGDSGNVECNHHKSVNIYQGCTRSHDLPTDPIAKRPRDSLVSSSLHEEESKPLQKNCFFVHHKISPFLHQQINCRRPSRLICQLDGHAGAVNRIKWCKPEYGHLLASASMDTTVKVWNAFSSVTRCLQSFRFHTKAVRDLCWSQSGREVLSCGYDKTACLVDVMKGSEISRFEHHEFLTCIKYHPINPNYFVAGSKDSIVCWDIRASERPMRIYNFRSALGLVQDILFLRNGSEFVISTEMVSRDTSDRTIIVYDFTSGVVLSNQVFQERYTSPRLDEHPHQSEMMAQTNGNYIALFSTIRPYKMNKCKRFDKHKVEGYSIGCCFSPDGQFVLSGGSDGKVTVYDYQRAASLQKLGEQREIYLDVAWHPVLPSTIATSSWSGKITLWH